MTVKQTDLSTQLLQIEAEARKLVDKGQEVLEKAQKQIDTYQAKLDKIQRYRGIVTDLTNLEQERTDLEATLTGLKTQKDRLLAQMAQTTEGETLTRQELPVGINIAELKGQAEPNRPVPETVRVVETESSLDILGLEELDEPLGLGDTILVEEGEGAQAGRNGHHPAASFR